jgi:hypothetical protein
MPDTEVELEETAVDWEGLNERLMDIFRELYVPVTTSEWKNWPIADQLALRKVMATLFATVEPASTPGGKSKTAKSFLSVFRPPYDETIWKGHKDGSVPIAVKSIRTERKDDAKTPGRKASKPTADDVFAELG